MIHEVLYSTQSQILNISFFKNWNTHDDVLTSEDCKYSSTIADTTLEQIHISLNEVGWQLEQNSKIKLVFILFVWLTIIFLFVEVVNYNLNV